MSDSGNDHVPVTTERGDYPNDLRTRIAAVIDREVDGFWEPLDVADAVIRELAESFVDFGVWLSEEISGKPLSRIDIESCIDEWKWLNDESRWLKDEDND